MPPAQAHAHFFYDPNRRNVARDRDPAARQATASTAMTATPTPVTGPAGGAECPNPVAVLRPMPPGAMHRAPAQEQLSLRQQVRPGSGGCPHVFVKPVRPRWEVVLPGG